jgi:WD40 repeat protein
MKGHKSTVWQLDFSADAKYMVSCSEDKTLMVWDIEDIEKDFKVKGTEADAHTRYVYSCSWLKAAIGDRPLLEGSDIIASCGADNKLCIFELSRKSLDDKDSEQFEYNILLSKSNAHETDVNCVAFHPNIWGLLATVADDKSVKLWKIIQE